MPTKTFFNLPEEKRLKLLGAIRRELSRVPFEAVSINQIVRMAGIPRGSFYQYFADKQDMLHYLLADYQRMLRRRALTSLRHSGGDLFQMFLDILDFTYAFATEEQHNAFCRSVFSDIRLNAELLRQQANGNPCGELMDQLLPHIDLSVLDIRNQEDFEHMLGILFTLAGEAFAKVFFDLANYEHSRSQYVVRLELLKRGFLKTKKAEK